MLVFATIPVAFLIGLTTVFARRSAATSRVLITGAGSGLAATLTWLFVVAIDPPIPPSAGSGLAATVVAVVVAILASAGSAPGACSPLCRPPAPRWR